MRPALKEIIGSPLLPFDLEIIQNTLESEQVRRERFYEEMSPEDKVEFINGEIIMHSPARDKHTLTIKNLLELLDLHVRRHGLGLVRFEKALVVLRRNDYEPDIVFFGPEKAAAITPGLVKYPPPDFIAEVLSVSTETRDRGIKLTDYAANGVREYWIIDADEETVEKYTLAGESYAPAAVFRDGTICCEAVPGFEIPVRAIFDEELNFAAVQRIVAA